MVGSRCRAEASQDGLDRAFESSPCANSGSLAASPGADPAVISAMREDAALKEGVELDLDESRRVGAGVRLGVRDEARGVLLH